MLNEFSISVKASPPDSWLPGGLAVPCRITQHRPPAWESNQGEHLSRLSALQQRYIMPETSSEATFLPVAVFGFCVVWRLDLPYILCSPLKATLGLQHPCSDEVQKCLIYFPHIFSMTYQDLLMDTPGLCTEMPDFSCICKIDRTNHSELALGFFGALPECFLYQLLLPTLTELLSRRVRPVSIFFPYLRGCYTQE